VRVAVAADIHVRWFHEELVVLDVGRGEYFALDELGGRLWDELSRGSSLEEAVEKLAPGYDVEKDRLREDARTLLEDLLRRGLFVETREGPRGEGAPV
jgi:hypothetical protein